MTRPTAMPQSWKVPRVLVSVTVGGVFMTHCNTADLDSAMNETTAEWEERLAAHWAAFDDMTAEAFVARLDGLAAELPAGSAVALYERGGGYDSTGRPELAIPLYRSALDAGLSGSRRRQAVIQMASSIRNLDGAAEAAELLRAEMAAGSDELDGAVRGFLALALIDLGREREAAALALAALAPCLPRFGRSLARYAVQIGAAPP